MSTALSVSSFELPVSSEQASRFAFHGGAAREHGMELPQVVPASRLGGERPAAATVMTGIGSLDTLTGGLPRGGLTEICGPASSGRTSVLLALMAQMTAPPTPELCSPEYCALVDATDSFDPKSAEAAGVDLGRLLWVRCTKHRVIGRSGDRVNERSGQWPMVGGQPKSQITNRKLQIDSLEQVLKAADLLLQGGGFGLVVVDLGDVPAQAARRVPLTSWFRFRRAVENTRTVLVVLEQEPYAKTCASVVLKLSAVRSQRSAGLQASASGQWSAASGQQKDEAVHHGRILSGLAISAEISRATAQRKKPVQSACSRWESKTAWAG